MTAAEIPVLTIVLGLMVFRGIGRVLGFLGTAALAGLGTAA